MHKFLLFFFATIIVIIYCYSYFVWSRPWQGVRAAEVRLEAGAPRAGRCVSLCDFDLH